MHKLMHDLPITVFYSMTAEHMFRVMVFVSFIWDLAQGLF